MNKLWTALLNFPVESVSCDFQSRLRTHEIIWSFKFSTAHSETPTTAILYCGPLPSKAFEGRMLLDRILKFNSSVNSFCLCLENVSNHKIQDFSEWVLFYWTVKKHPLGIFNQKLTPVKLRKQIHCFHWKTKTAL